MIAADRILEGAYYSMEQAGHLVSDAALLYERERWASSVVLAVFSMEEMGKSEELFRRALAAQTGGPQVRNQIMDGLSDHRRKLSFGRGPLTISAAVWLGKDPPEENTPEMAEIDRQLDENFRLAQQNAPLQDHQARMRALYVDLVGDGDWVRPSETSPDDAYLVVSAANIEYGERRRKFIRPTEPFAVQVLRDRTGFLPDLPEPRPIHWPRR